MSLTVKHLNADATFLLTFAPAFAPPDTRHKFPGSFTILLDPWLEGDSVIYHPSFANSRHSTPPALSTLADLEDEVDLIIISQDKADHLSRETICTLLKDTSIRFLATAKAASKIRAWNHFRDPGIIHVMEPFKVGKKDNIVRIPIQPYSSASADGEVTIANICDKRDLTGLHNAIGITYCPPGTLLTSWAGTPIELENMHVMSVSRTRNNSLTSRSVSSTEPSQQALVRGRPKAKDFVPRPALQITKGQDDIVSNNIITDYVPAHQLFCPEDLPLKIQPSTSGSRVPDVSTVSKRPDNHERVTSVIFSPHGLSSPSKTLKPYIDNHLRQLHHALPVTALFHSLNREAMPWWLGGVVTTGAPGGVQLVREARVKAWISAHDEEKELMGWATRWTKSARFDVSDVKGMLEGEGVCGTDICMLGCGETRRFT